MRRREKFVIASILLGFGLFAVQIVSLDYRYWAVAVLALFSFFISAWALAEDLQPFEWLTIVPNNVLYTAAVGLFYFLLPENLLSRLFILVLFGVGQYALLLTGNIYSVAKGRTIQLIHAAHAVGLLFTILTFLLFTNVIFSLKFPFYWNGLLVGGVAFPLVFMSLWAVQLEQKISQEVVALTGVMTLLLMELAVVLSLFPLSVWNTALLLMGFLYLGLGVLHNALRGILFEATLREYSLVAALVGLLFILIFPLK